MLAAAAGTGAIDLHTCRQQRRICYTSSWAVHQAKGRGSSQLTSIHGCSPMPVWWEEAVHDATVDLLTWPGDTMQQTKGIFLYCSSCWDDSNLHQIGGRFTRATAGALCKHAWLSATQHKVRNMTESMYADTSSCYAHSSGCCMQHQRMHSTNNALSIGRAFTHQKG